MVDFAKLRNKSENSIKFLTNEMEKLSTKQDNNKSDDRFWKSSVDKAGNGFAIFRFLPAPPGEDVPFVRYWDHGFQGPTGLWYIEKSRTSLGTNEADPVGEYNRKLWATGVPENKLICSKQKRRLHYVSNILMIQDSAAPENNGKVFLYQYGVKIFDKIKEAMNSPFPDQVKFDPFHVFEGANFKLKVRKVEGYQNYDKSEFESVSQLKNGNEDEIRKIWESTYSLTELVEPSKFKSYDELKAKLNRVLNDNDNNIHATAAANIIASKEETTPLWEDAPKVNDVPADDDDDGSMEYFQQLAGKTR